MSVSKVKAPHSLISADGLKDVMKKNLMFCVGFKREITSKTSLDYAAS